MNNGKIRRWSCWSDCWQPSTATVGRLNYGRLWTHEGTEWIKVFVAGMQNPIKKKQRTQNSSHSVIQGKGNNQTRMYNELNVLPRKQLQTCARQIQPPGSCRPDPRCERKAGDRIRLSPDICRQLKTPPLSVSFEMDWRCEFDDSCADETTPPNTCRYISTFLLGSNQYIRQAMRKLDGETWIQFRSCTLLSINKFNLEWRKGFCFFCNV